MSFFNLDMETLTVKENELKTKDTYFCSKYDKCLLPHGY